METKIWMKELFQQVSPLLLRNGGPIILVQVENEYGSYGDSATYMEEIRDILLEHVGTSALLYTTDGAVEGFIRDGRVQGALTAINFGVGAITHQVIDVLRKFMPTGPILNSEFYPGWITHWGENLQQVDTDAVLKTLRDMINATVNVNVYMFFGGTNFEFTSGANFDVEHEIQPHITSYDFDAPLNEAGDPTPKYYAIRDLMSQYFPHVNDTPAPTPSPKGAYGELTLSVELDLLSLEGRSILGRKYEDLVNDVKLPTFEALRQRAGLILYETTLNDTDGVLQITQPRDWIYVYVDGQLAGSINRMNSSYNLTLKSKPGSKLSLLVENQGRINFGDRLHDFKGYAWINGHNLGRYWPGLGPQVTLYVPGAWLLAPPAVNSLRLLELERPPHPLSIQLIDYPILNRTKF